MKLLSYCLLAVLCQPVNALAQSPPSAIEPLQIGDTIPADLEITNLYNYPVNKIRISDLRGKLVILDFWATWCGSCISSFPKMDSLNKKFADQVQVLMVNIEDHSLDKTRQKVLATIAKLENQTQAPLQIPIAYASEVLKKRIPIQYVPHLVWINGDGVIKAITSDQEATPENISGVLQGEQAKFRYKKDLLNFDTQVPLFVEGNGGSGKEILYRSMFTSFVEGIGGSSGYRMHDGLIKGIYLFNQPLTSILKLAYRDLFQLPDNRILDESNSRRKTNASTPDLYSHLYCYESIIPASDEKQALHYLREDINRFLKITVKVEKRPAECLVLTVPEKSVATNSHSGKMPDFDLEPNTRNKYLININPSEIVRLLNLYLRIPLINETGLDIPQSVELPFDLNNIQELQNAFSKMGLILTKHTRQIEMICITSL